MLLLHNVPGGHGSPVSPKRSAPWDFGQLYLCIQVLLGLEKFSHGLSRFPWRAIGGKGHVVPERLRGTLRFALRSPTDDSTFPAGSSRCNQGLTHLFTFYQGFLRMKRGRRAALKHVCAHDIKKVSRAILIVVSWDQRVVSARSRTQHALVRRARKPSHYRPPLSFVTAYYVLSRFVAFTPYHYGLPHRDCHGKFFVSFKILLGI